MPIPGEGGHTTFAAASVEEMEILSTVSKQFDHFSNERVVSGPGLVNLYRAVAELDGLPAIHTQPERISAAALDGGDALALDTLHIFCAMLGGFVGDLAVLFKASGGVYLAGGILPQLREFLPRSAFRERFFNKGVMRGFLAGVPVRLIEHGRLGVLGAAGLAAASPRLAPRARRPRREPSPPPIAWTGPDNNIHWEVKACWQASIGGTSCPAISWRACWAWP